ncbi:MAG: winged helix-turn-helix transcriptional regulator [Candidatus Hodarchaeales archaeon]|jgi:DNA-binding Lrp family transcriptional regulator
MDSIDKGIIVDLMMNARISYQEMANKYDLSANAIKNRIKKMLAVGMFKEHYIALSNAMVDCEPFVCYIDTDCTEDIDAFADKLGNDFRINTVGPSSRGRYFVLGIYPNGSTGLSELGNFIRSFPFVNNIELFPTISPNGTKVQLSQTELIILKNLFENPRIPISEIARRSGIAPGMITDILNNLIHSGVIETGTRILPNAGDLISLIFRIYFDAKSTSATELLKWMKNEFPDDFAMPANISAIQPSFSAIFSVVKLKEIHNITQRLRQHPHIISTTTFIWEPIRLYPDLRTIRLKEMITKTDSKN